MRILLTNDDGIHAPGIQALRKSLEAVAEIYVVAPEQERSAMGHAITMHKPLHARPMEYGTASRGWGVNGTPADCAKLGVEALLSDRPDLLLSGINNGSNLGRDVFYSGTVSAAMEGVFLGIPSMALSLENGTAEGFQWVSRFMRWWIESSEFRMPSPDILYNINFPGVNRGNPKGLRVVRLGKREYANEFHRRVDPRGREYFWLAGRPVMDRLSDLDTDVGAVANGYVALTPIHMNLTAEAELSRIPVFAIPETF